MDDAAIISVAPLVSSGLDRAGRRLPLLHHRSMSIELRLDE